MHPEWIHAENRGRSPFLWALRTQSDVHVRRWPYKFGDSFLLYSPPLLFQRRNKGNCCPLFSNRKAYRDFCEMCIRLISNQNSFTFDCMSICVYNFLMQWRMTDDRWPMKEIIWNVNHMLTPISFVSDSRSRQLYIHLCEYVNSITTIYYMMTMTFLLSIMRSG